MQSVATILKTTTRAEDFVFRYGGDEFLVVLPEIDGVSTHIVERIRAAIAQQDTDALGIDAPVTVSIGVERLLPSDEANVDSVLDRADRAMYEEKRRRSHCRA